MNDSEVTSLKDLNRFHSAPNLSDDQIKKILNELNLYLDQADWFTVGIMASSAEDSINHLREMESFFSWPMMNIKTKPSQAGPVFLKANQNTGDVYIRIEKGLGEGILLSCQKNDPESNAETLGPFPLNFFKLKG